MQEQMENNIKTNIITWMTQTVKTCSGATKSTRPVADNPVLQSQDRGAEVAEDM